MHVVKGGSKKVSARKKRRNLDRDGEKAVKTVMGNLLRDAYQKKLNRILSKK